eukprot:2835799-Rhodomonas_salina.2
MEAGLRQGDLWPHAPTPPASPPSRPPRNQIRNSFGSARVVPRKETIAVDLAAFRRRGRREGKVQEERSEQRSAD